MASDSQLPAGTPSRAALWAGRVLMVLLALMLGLSGVMKLKGGPELAEGMKPLGLPESMAFPLGCVELGCLLMFLIPRTTVLGAILLTGYMGGAICTHWRVGDPFVVQIVVAMVVWLSVALREPRLWRLLWRS